ncbi:hypothetical protein H0W80_03595 [Candidatus Saccharibacteria bacterium]|nr:hypothetical protein [Candidatus Saccharibacteria bacterium]
MTAYSEDCSVYQRVAIYLRGCSDDTISAMKAHVEAENFHPDVEFFVLEIEGSMSDSEFLDALLNEADVRRRKKTIKAQYLDR